MTSALWQANITDPIVANSTQLATNSALAIIRISGFQDLNDFQDRLAPVSKDLKNGPIGPLSCVDSFLDSLDPGVLKRANILDGRGQVLDDCMVCYFKGPRSFTGQNVLEIHCHGNLINVEQIIESLLELPRFREALPGEFSFRAVQNNKMSLLEAEQLGFFLSSESTQALRVGRQFKEQLKSHLGVESQFHSLLLAFEKLQQSLELGIEFLEDIGDEGFVKNYRESLLELDVLLEGLAEKMGLDIERFGAGKVVLLGPVNVGKSTLFNGLVKEDRAIVSDIAGTTRDYQSVVVSNDAYKFEIFDTAGVRDKQASDPIERLGIDRAIKLCRDAFLKVGVFNVQQLDSIEKDELAVFKNIEFDLLVITHWDWSSFSSSKEAILRVSDFVKLLNSDAVVLFGDGRDHLFSRFILDQFNSVAKSFESLNTFWLNRHIRLVKRLHKRFSVFKTQYGSPEQLDDLGIVSYELADIREDVVALLGTGNTEELFASIFDNFCIGK